MKAPAILSTRAPAATVLVRLMVGGVFLSEGIQKFLLPDALGVGRFTRIGIPWPGVLAPVVGGVEIVCGALVLAGLVTRAAAVPLFVVISVALVITKLPILADGGFWAMAHEARTDGCMFLGSLFLIIVGGGRYSLDARLAKRAGAPPGERRP